MNDIKAMLKRIKQGNDGAEFIEFLENVSRMNYEAFKKSKGAELNEYHKGYAGCVDFLLDQFRKCDQETKSNEGSSWAS